VRFSQLIRQYGMPVMTVHAPCLVNHEGVVCCGDRKGFSGASLCTAISPLHCTGYQILRPHFQTCGPNIEKIVEENFAQRIKVLRPAVCDECACLSRLQDMCAVVNKSIEWRRYKNSLLRQYHLKGAGKPNNALE